MNERSKHPRASAQTVTTFHVPGGERDVTDLIIAEWKYYFTAKISRVREEVSGDSGEQSRSQRGKDGRTHSAFWRSKHLSLSHCFTRIKKFLFYYLLGRHASPAEDFVPLCPASQRVMKRNTSGPERVKNTNASTCYLYTMDIMM